MGYQDPTPEALRALLTAAQTIAVVGASSDPSRPSHGIFRALLDAGYRVIPVNPKETSVLGVPAVGSLADIEGTIDIVDVFRRAEATPEVARDAVAAGAKALWLQSGVYNEEAAAIGQAGGMVVVMDRCIKVDHALLRISRQT